MRGPKYIVKFSRNIIDSSNIQNINIHTKTNIFNAGSVEIYHSSPRE